MRVHAIKIASQHRSGLLVLLLAMLRDLRTPMFLGASLAAALSLTIIALYHFEVPVNLLGAGALLYVAYRAVQPPEFAALGHLAGSVLAALLRGGPDRVVIANRTGDKAAGMATSHADLGAAEGIGLDELPTQEPFDLVINATSLGHDGEVPELPPGLFADGALCYDMNYGAAAAPLEKRCSDLGVRYSDGLGMLVEQAAEAFQIWRGVRPETASVRAQLP